MTELLKQLPIEPINPGAVQFFLRRFAQVKGVRLQGVATFSSGSERKTTLSQKLIEKMQTIPIGNRIQIRGKSLLRYIEFRYSDILPNVMVFVFHFLPDAGKTEHGISVLKHDGVVCIPCSQFFDTVTELKK